MVLKGIFGGSMVGTNKGRERQRGAATSRREIIFFLSFDYLAVSEPDRGSVQYLPSLSAHASSSWGLTRR